MQGRGAIADHRPLPANLALHLSRYANCNRHLQSARCSWYNSVLVQKRSVMIIREIVNLVRQRASEFPVLTVTGPRQSGKTTLVRACFPHYAYANLEDPETRELAETDYRRFFALSSPRPSRRSSTSAGANAADSSSPDPTSRFSERPSPSRLPDAALS